jgi:sporulation protein YlmC with PRC-barrel domain
MLRKLLLAGACLVAAAGMASAASVKPGASAAPGPQLAAAGATAQMTHQTPAMIRASAFIGETVRNGKGEKIGSVDDLILNRGNKVLYAVISVGDFLGTGSKLVAVPFQDLKIGAKDVSGVVIYDTTKQQLKARPAFTYAASSDDMTRDRYLRSAEHELDRWQDRISNGVESAKSNAKTMQKGASEQVNAAWKKVQAKWAVLQNSTGDAWQGAKKKFDKAIADLQKAWDDATS